MATLCVRSKMLRSKALAKGLQWQSCMRFFFSFSVVFFCRHASLEGILPCKIKDTTKEAYSMRSKIRLSVLCKGKKKSFASGPSSFVVSFIRSLLCFLYPLSSCFLLKDTWPMRIIFSKDKSCFLCPLSKILTTAVFKKYQEEKYQESAFF